MRSEKYRSKFVKLGWQIKKIREDKNFTQQKLADKVGIHLSYIGNIEIGAKRPSLETLFRIAELDFIHFERAGNPDETSPFDLVT